MKKQNCISSVFVFMCSLFVGCTNLPLNILPEGKIILAGTVPEATDMDYGQMAYGFLPLTAVSTEASSQVTYIKFNRAESEISIFKDGQHVATAEASNLSLLGAGTFAVQMMQVMPEAMPVWYAPDSYFIARGLPLPSENDGERFMRGALGNAAIYITPELAIHSAPYVQGGTGEIGGIWVPDAFLAEVSRLVDIGTPVIID